MDQLKRYQRRRGDAIDATGYEEIMVAVIGNVDAGKSSTVGTLLTGVNDDGKGLSRSVVFVHPHEHQTGRTSDVSHQYMKSEEYKRIISFVDLPGHEAYLKTTIAGLTSINPDFAMVCISDKITNITSEHMRICLMLQIPFIILFTKCDAIPQEITKNLIATVKNRLLSQGIKAYQFRAIKDFSILENNTKIVPFFITSNKTGDGLDLIRYALNTFKPRQRFLPDGFVVDHVYTVPGHGVVFAGISKHEVSCGDQLYMGPFDKGEFALITVKSIHNDYRYDIKTLPAGRRGCLAIGMRPKEKYKYKLHAGLILSPEKPKNICAEFVAEVTIVHHSTTIALGYCAFINCGMLHVPVVFTKITDLNGEESDVVRSGDKVRVTMKFMKNLNYVPIGQQIIFREGTIRGFGNVIQIL